VGTASLLALGVNGIVGVGIFFTPAVLAGLAPGPLGATAYLATALLLVPVAWTVALLGGALPLDGGPAVWARSAFGEAAGILVGWVAVVSALLSAAAVFAGLAQHLCAGTEVPAVVPLTAWACLGVLALIAALGLSPSAWTWNALTVAKLLPLVLLLAIAVTRDPQPSRAVSEQSADFGRALLVALFPLQGFEVVPVLAGSARRGRVSLPFATIGSLLGAAGLYAMLQLVCVRAVPDLEHEASPLVAAAGALAGPGFRKLVELGTTVSALGIAFGMVVMTPRYVAALGGDATSWLARVDARGTPRTALLLTVGVVGALASVQGLESLFVLSSAAVLFQYLAAIASLAVLSIRRRHGLTAWSVLPAALALGAVGMLAQAVSRKELFGLCLVLSLGGLVLALVRRATRRAGGGLHGVPAPSRTPPPGSASPEA